MGVSGQLRPSHFTPGEDSQYPLYRRLGGPQRWSEQCVKSRPMGILTQTHLYECGCVADFLSS